MIYEIIEDVKVKDRMECQGCFFKEHYGCAFLYNMVGENYSTQVDKLHDCSDGYIYKIKDGK